MKTKTITQTGYLVKGTATIKRWGGDEGNVKMDENFIPYNKLNKSNLLGCINDGQYGCQSVIYAELDIYIKYDNGSTEFDRTIYTDHRPHLDFAFKGIH